MKIPQSQKKALELAAQILPPENPGYLVGGFVRDTFLGRESADIDLAMSGEPAFALEMARHLANAARRELPSYRASPFSLDADFGVARVVFTPLQNLEKNKGFYFDFAVFNGDSIEADLAHRDFTINALALPLAKFLAADGVARLEDAIELPGGRADLKARIIRPVSEQNLIDDPLRMLRGIRLRAQLFGKTQRWEFAPGTLALFEKLSSLITGSAVERVRDELNKTWLAGDIAYTMNLLQDTSLLASLFPEFAGWSSMQNFVRVSRLLNRLEWMLTPPKDFNAMIEPDEPRAEAVIRYWPEMMIHLTAQNREKLALLYWMALLYYVSQPLDAEEFEPDDDEEEVEEVRSLRQIIGQFRFSREATDHIDTVIKQQAVLTELSQRFNPKTQTGLSNREIFRFLRDCSPVYTEVLLMWLAEVESDWSDALALVDFLSRKALGNDNERLIDKPRLLDGSQLIKLLPMKPGPKVGQILRELEEAQADGQIKTIEEAVELARRLNNEEQQPE